MRARVRTSSIAPPVRLALCAICALAAAAPAASRAAAPPPARSRPAATPARSAPPYTPDERALLALEANGRARVAEIVRRMQGLPEGPALRALEDQAEAVKRDTRMALLAEQSRQARARGDEARARLADAALDLLRHPEHAAPASITPVPEKPVPAKGGAR